MEVTLHYFTSDKNNYFRATRVGKSESMFLNHIMGRIYNFIMLIFFCDLQVSKVIFIYYRLLCPSDTIMQYLLSIEIQKKCVSVSTGVKCRVF